MATKISMSNWSESTKGYNDTMGSNGAHAAPANPMYSGQNTIPSMNVPNIPYQDTFNNGEVPPEDEDKKSVKKKVLIIIGIILGVIALIYAIGCVWFSGHFFPNSTFSSHDVSMESSSDFASEIKNRVQDYKLQVSSEDCNYSLTVNGTDISMQVDSAAIAKDACANQNFWAWPYEVFQSHDVSDVVKASFDTTALTNILTQSVNTYNAAATPSVNAGISYNADFKTYIISPQTYGKQIDLQKFIETISKTVQSTAATYEVDSNDFIQPTILMSDSRLQTACEKANKYISGEIPLTMGGTTSVGTIDKATIVSWVVLNENVEATISQDAVNTWVDALSSQLNTAGNTKTWTRGDGKVCTVSGGTYGWKVDTSSLTDTVITQLDTFNFTTIDIPCTQTADIYTTAGGRDFGAYVDVDISEQHVRYYDASNNLLYECNCVTGLPTAERATPTGAYYLRMKQSPATLVSSTKDASGNPTYTSQVTYWMPFIGNSVGLHDASWQSSFGGSRYLTNGSHGCVNLPTESAGWFYNNLTVNTCIITHN